MGFVNYYEVLGVSSSATSEEMKKAYRKLAMQHHPDRNRGDTVAEEKFKVIGLAYAILSDDAKRQKFDDGLTVQERTPSPSPSAAPAWQQETPDADPGSNNDVLNELKKTAMDPHASSEVRMEAGFCFVTNCWDDAELFTMATSAKVLKDVGEAAAIKYVELSDNYQNLLELARASRYEMARAAAWKRCAASNELEILYEVAFSRDADLDVRAEAGLKYVSASTDYDKLFALAGACGTNSALGEVFDAAYMKCVAAGMVDGGLQELVLNRWYGLAFDRDIDYHVKIDAARRYIELSDDYAGLLDIARRFGNYIAISAGNKCLQMKIRQNDLAGLSKLAFDSQLEWLVREKAANKYIELSDDYEGLLGMARRGPGSVQSKAGNKCLSICISENDLTGINKLANDTRLEYDVREKARAAIEKLQKELSQKPGINPLAGDGLILSDTSFKPNGQRWMRNLAVRVKEKTTHIFLKRVA